MNLGETQNIAQGPYLLITGLFFLVWPARHLSHLNDMNSGVVPGAHHE